MRFLALTERGKGFTLIELLIVLSVLSILALAGVPALSDYVSNSRIREAANVAATSAVIARNEAIKRNTTVKLTSDGTTLMSSELIGGADTPIQAVSLVSGTRIGVFTVSFDSLGRLSPFPGAKELQATVDGGPRIRCSGEIVCPILRIETGGIVGLCASGICP